MARTSRFKTPADAERWAIDKGAPPRGSRIPITSMTRGLAAAWMTAAGVPAAIVGNLSVAQRNEAWHDLTGATLERFKLLPMPRVTPETPEPSPWRIETPEPKNEEDTKAMQEQMPFNRPAPTPALPQDEHAAALAALQKLLAPKAPALDENAVLEIVHRHMGQTITAATTSATEQARTELADIVEEARAIVNGAPRVLRIEVAGRIKDMPPAPRHPLFDALLAFTVASREPGGLVPILVGPAGSGKTTACEHVAQALGLPFYSNGALTGTHELFGYMDAAGRYHTTPFRQAFQFGGVYLMDELDRTTDPSVPVSLNSALANGFASFPDSAEPVRRHPDFVPLVAANTFGRGADRLYVGANQLDAATLNRFAFLSWDYDEALERALAGDDTWTAYVQAARAACYKHKIRHIISPRASMGGANLRRVGLGFDMVADACIWQGLDTEQRARIVADIPDGIARRAQAPRIILAAE
jgi:cobaltochelatase CobS